MRPSLERLWRRKGGSLFLLFALLSFFYGLVVRGRNCLYHWGVLPKVRVNIPVISIGNVSVGGTGKTPLTAFVAAKLSRYKRTAILSRGFGGEVEKLKRPVEISSGEGPLYPWAYCGDEPFLLACNLTGVSLFVGRDRVAAADMAMAKGAQVLLLDDGMQHRRLARDLEIVLVDGKMPLKGGGLLPLGTLREPLLGLKRADIVVVNHTGGKVPAELREDLRRYTQAKIVAASYRATSEVPLKGKQVAIFCAIGQPDRFRETVESLGAIVEKELFYPDHAVIEVDALNAFFAGSSAELAVCTEKDWVKLPMNQAYSLPVYPIKIELQIGEGEADWESFF